MKPVKFIIFISLALFVLASLVLVQIVQANDGNPYHNLGATVYPVSGQDIYQYKTDKYPDANYAYQHNYPVQYPLFYYVPHIRDVEIPTKSTIHVPEFQDANGLLDLKSEQAIKNNTQSHSKSNLLPVPIDSTPMRFSGSELSEITASSLILLARKKQQLEILIPELLRHQRLFMQDREKLKKLLHELNTLKKLDRADEIWVEQLSKEYLIQPTIQNNSRTEHLQPSSTPSTFSQFL